jgi:hypothetical protein
MEEDDSKYEIGNFLKEARKWKLKAMKHSSFRRMTTVPFKLSVAPAGKMVRRGTTFELLNEEAKTPVKKKQNATSRKIGAATESKARKSSLLSGGSKEE